MSKKLSLFFLLTFVSAAAMEKIVEEDDSSQNKICRALIFYRENEKEFSNFLEKPFIGRNERLMQKINYEIFTKVQSIPIKAVLKV